MNKLQKAWNDIKFSILHRNVTFTAVIFTIIASLKYCSVIDASNSHIFLGIMLMNFVLQYIFLFVIGLPYYFIRNILFPPKPEIKIEEKTQSSEFLP